LAYPQFSSGKGSETGPVRIFMPGLTVFPRRGLHLVIEAALGLSGGFILEISGVPDRQNAKLHARLQRMARPLEAAGKLVWLGRLPGRDYAATLANAHAVAVVRLKSNGETSAGMLDGMSAGKPIVASAVGTFGEYLRNRESGILVENSVAAWRDALQSLIDDASLRERLGRAALHAAQTELGPVAIAKTHVKAYGSLCTPPKLGLG
jgi:glycosyltransferase involved in cell wall biosynthesis